MTNVPRRERRRRIDEAVAAMDLEPLLAAGVRTRERFMASASS